MEDIQKVLSELDHLARKWQHEDTPALRGDNRDDGQGAVSAT
jgi:hypothetical protein